MWLADVSSSRSARTSARACPPGLQRAQVVSLGRAHARSGDASMISGSVGDDDTFDRALARFAEAYADRTEQDYDELIGAVDDGRVPIVRDL